MILKKKKDGDDIHKDGICKDGKWILWMAIALGLLAIGLAVYAIWGAPDMDSEAAQLGIEQNTLMMDNSGMEDDSDNLPR